MTRVVLLADVWPWSAGDSVRLPDAVVEKLLAGEMAEVDTDEPDEDDDEEE